MGRRYPAVTVLAVVATAIILTNWWRPPSWMILAGVVTALLLLPVMLRKRWRSPVIIVVLIVLGGATSLRFASATYESGPASIGRLVRQPARMTVYGVVDDWPRLHRERTDIVIAVDSGGVDRIRPIQGRLMLQVDDTTTTLQRGDYVEIERRIYPLKKAAPITGMNYHRYLRLRNIEAIAYLPTLLDVRVAPTVESRWYGIVDRIRAGILGVFGAALSERAAALAGGFLIGETRHIAPEVYDHFRNSGTLHLLAVSGSNVALVLLVVGAALRPVGLRRTTETLLLLGVIGLFVLLSYGEPSVVRAGVMASLVLIARWMGRKYDLNNIIALTALVILLVEPSQLFSIGFQLSFVTAWGLIFAVPRVTDLLRAYHGHWLYRYLVFPFIIALTAQVCSMPLIALHFDRVPALSVFANIVVVPLVSAAVVGIVVLLLMYALLPVFGLLLGRLLDPLMLLILEALELFGGEGSVVVDTVGVGWLTVIGVYALLLVAVVALHRKRWRPRLLLGMLMIVNMVLLLSIVGRLRAEGGREAVLFSVPGGATVLVRDERTGSADMCLTEIHATDYPVDERILAPALQQCGVERLRSVVVLAADYGVIDDVLRLAAEFDADSLYYPVVLHGMVDEHDLPVGLAGRLVSFGRLEDADRQVGWKLSGRCAVLTAPERTIVLAPGLGDVPKYVLDDAGIVVLSWLKRSERRKIDRIGDAAVIVVGGGGLAGLDRSVHNLHSDGVLRVKVSGVDGGGSVSK